MRHGRTAEMVVRRLRVHFLFWKKVAHPVSSHESHAHCVLYPVSLFPCLKKLRKKCCQRSSASCAVDTQWLLRNVFLCAIVPLPAPFCKGLEWRAELSHKSCATSPQILLQCRPSNKCSCGTTVHKNPPEKLEGRSLKAPGTKAWQGDGNINFPALFIHITYLYYSHALNSTLSAYTDCMLIKYFNVFKKIERLTTQFGHCILYLGTK